MVGLVHKDDYYCSPPALIDKLQTWTGLKFGLDVAANESNHICINYLDEFKNALNVDWILQIEDSVYKRPVFCNPPRSKNAKFVRKAHEQWQKHNLDIVMLLTWNDFGNKYGQECIIQPKALGQLIEIHNLGKIIFWKDGQVSKFPSRLNYCWVWFKKRPELVQSII